MDSLTETKFGFKDAQFEACQSDCSGSSRLRIQANNRHSVNADGCIVLRLPRMTGQAEIEAVAKEVMTYRFGSKCEELT